MLASPQWGALEPDAGRKSQIKAFYLGKSGTWKQNSERKTPRKGAGPGHQYTETLRTRFNKCAHLKSSSIGECGVPLLRECGVPLMRECDVPLLKKLLAVLLELVNLGPLLPL